MSLTLQPGGRRPPLALPQQPLPRTESQQQQQQQEERQDHDNGAPRDAARAVWATPVVSDEHDHEGELAIAEPASAHIGEAGIFASSPSSQTELGEEALLQVQEGGDETATEQAGHQLEPPTIGSADPHRTGEPASLSTAKRHKRGSRSLEEPELPSVLAGELLPEANVPPQSDWEEAPPRQESDGFEPADFKEVLSKEYREKTDAFARASLAAASAARRKDVHRAKHLRPQVFSMQDDEAHTEKARGKRWDLRGCNERPPKRPKLLQPSSWPEDPPPSDLNVDNVLDIAGTQGQVHSDGSSVRPRFKRKFEDQAVISWMAQGFRTFSRAQPVTQMAGLHVGALTRFESYEKQSQKNIQARWWGGPYTRCPPYSPCRVLPQNICQRGLKDRLTVDPTIRYEDHVDPVNETFEGDFPWQLKMVSERTAARGAAILQTCGLPVRGTVIDGTAYYRKAGLQRADAWQYVYFSGKQARKAAVEQSAPRKRKRVSEPPSSDPMDESPEAWCDDEEPHEGGAGFYDDQRVAFGGKLFPKSLSRMSNFIVWAVRAALRKFDKEHPPRCPKALRWLEDRRALGGAELGALYDAEWDDRAACLHFVSMFIDDLSVFSVADPIWRRGADGVEVQHNLTTRSGKQTPETRADCHAHITLQIFTETGHESEPVKQQLPHLDGANVLLLGAQINCYARRRALGDEKRIRYARECTAAREEAQRTHTCKKDTFRALVHKLLHACEYVPGGRLHTCKLLNSIHAEHRLEHGVVPVGADAVTELQWWEEHLPAETAFVPLASRGRFIACDHPSVICYYGDASRELPKPSHKGKPPISGWGFWFIVEDTLLCAWGEWSAEEVQLLDINALEFKTMNMALEVSTAKRPSAKYVLEFTDNSAAESVAESMASTKPLFIQLSEERDVLIRQRDLFTMSDRVSSKANVWADWLSRGDVALVREAAQKADLSFERLTVPGASRSTTKLLEVARRRIEQERRGERSYERESKRWERESATGQWTRRHWSAHAHIPSLEAPQSSPNPRRQTTPQSYLLSDRHPPSHTE